MRRRTEGIAPRALTCRRVTPRPGGRGYLETLDDQIRGSFDLGIPKWPK